VGGTGVTTVASILAMAAHGDGRAASVVDMTGLAQKGGAVTTHVRLAKSPADIHAVRIAAGEADLVLGCDMVVVNDYWALSKIRADRSHVVLNTYEAMPGSFTRNTDLQFPAKDIVGAVRLALGGGEPLLVDASELALALMGDAIATNLFILGYAWQQGLVPVSFDALMKAIELNGAAVEMNKTAFAWGRLAAHDLPAVQRAAGIAQPPTAQDFLANGVLATSAAFEGDGNVAQTLDQAIAVRAKFLAEYQDAKYAAQYTQLMQRVRRTENEKAGGRAGLSEAVARYLFKLMAYKDEYEVARLYTTGDFEKRVRETFDGDIKVKFNLAPPLLARKDADGHLRKAEYGPWVFTAFKLLKRFKGLRGTALDPFGHTAERRMERRLIVDYRSMLEELLNGLSLDNHDLAVELARIPELIRGYGHVKEAHLVRAKAKEAELMARWRNPTAEHLAA
jgi:indolepyruvate ferredoxin oxidoreductase